MDDQQRQAKLAEMRERLAAIDPVTQAVNLVMGVRWITRRPLTRSPWVSYRIEFGDRTLGIVRRNGRQWRTNATDYPTLRDAERALVWANIGDILKALGPRAEQEGSRERVDQR
jgi:hypothetical protein